MTKASIEAVIRLVINRQSRKPNTKPMTFEIVVAKFGRNVSPLDLVLTELKVHPAKKPVVMLLSVFRYCEIMLILDLSGTQNVVWPHLWTWKPKMPHIQNFRKAFKIDKKANLMESAVAIESCAKADKAISDYLGEFAPANNEDGFRIRALMNLAARLYEHVQGMLVAISTGSPASAEALARVVVEGSVNIIYLAEKGDSGTLVKFFQSWLNEHNRKLDEWKGKISQQLESHETSTMIEERRKVVGIMQEFLSQIEVQCSIDVTNSKAEWPKSLYKRFEVLGRETDYYESYHRLSGASHITGEDTLMWFMFMQATPELAVKGGKEAWAYSIMMTRIASLFFVDATVACVEAYGRQNNSDLYQCKLDLQRAVSKIARQAGVPLSE